MKIYRCYVCGDDVTKEEQQRVSQMFNEDPNGLEIGDHIGLFRCSGPEDMFDENGWVVVCEDCFKKGKKEYTEYVDEMNQQMADDGPYGRII